MKKVSEEQPRDTFSLFLRRMSNGDYPVMNLLQEIRDKFALKSEKVEPLRVRPFSKMHETRLILWL